MARAVDEVLTTWREAERLLEQMEQDVLERRLLQFEVIRLRAVYKHLTGESIPDTAAALRLSRESIDAARRTLALARQRVRYEQSTADPTRRATGEG